MSLINPGRTHKYIAVKSASFRWMSFIEGNIYECHPIIYANKEVDESHCAVSGEFMWMGETWAKKVPIEKLLCKEYLKLIKDE